ncbi:unnamed protein product [Effrenium voratum]|nr:unnamed protein product [Effrenium voratum]
MARLLRRVAPWPLAAGCLQDRRAFCDGCPFGGAASSKPSPSRAAQAAPRLVEGKDFAVFRRDGSTAREAKLQDMLEALSSDPAQKAILLGEVHDDKVTHHLQLEVLRHLGRACRAQGKRLILSMEMFEMDVQDVLDEYVMHKAIREEDMLLDTRPWGNYMEDYRPLVEFCRAEGIRVLAANAPRRYVSLVSRRGTEVLDTLRAKAAGELRLPALPLPAPSEAYRRKFEETMSMPALQSKSGSCPFIGFSSDDLRKVRPEMMQAQQLWDHSMAKSLGEQLGAEEVSVLHLCGAFHCAHGLGIPEALPRYWPAGGESPDPDFLGPKQSPPGVVSVICWPGAVEATLGLVRGGQAPRPLKDMGDWVIITEETFQESS